MTPARILIVEDEAVVAFDLRNRLNRLGYVVVETTARGDAAVRLAEQLRPDLVLMDIRLQGEMDGIEAAEIIRERLHLPVVYLTAHADDATLARAQVSEPYGYILKPFEERELRTVIEMAFYKHMAEWKLQTSERRYAATLASIGDAVIATDESGCVTMMNPVAEELTGWTAAESQGHPLEKVFRVYDETTRQEVKDPAEHALLHGTVVPGVSHLILIRRDDREIPIEDRATPIQGGQGERMGAVIVFRDISERRRVEEHLRHAQKMEAVGQLAGGVAHDFNNMLTVILNYSDILLRSAGPDHPWTSSVTEIQRAAERSAEITRQLLTFCRKQMTGPKPLNLNSVVGQAEPIIRRLIGPDIELKFHLESGLEPVMADQGQLEQVLFNLVLNARDAIVQRGEIRIETQSMTAARDFVPRLEAGNYVLLQVTDTGQGIPTETIDRVFEPFFTTKEPGKGTGLGLSTVYGIVQQCRGHVEVRSKAGEGTTFTVYLPVALDVPDPEGPAARSVLPKGTETVLLVEDEGAVRSLARHVLTSCGYTVLEAEHGAAAVGIANSYVGRIDIVVADVVMPVMGAATMLNLIKERLPRLKVLLLSGHNDQGISAQTMDSGMRNFLAKPYKLDDLARAVRQVLDQPPPASERA